MQKVLIVFTDKYLAYSPTTLNIYHGLKNNGFDVEILTMKPAKHFLVEKLEKENIRYVYWKSLEKQSVYKKVVRRAGELIRRPHPLLNQKASAFISEISKSAASIYIAVDFFALWCVHYTGKKAHLVSLEIYENDVYYQQANFSWILSVIIPSEARYNHLFGHTIKPQIHLVQNAPAYTKVLPEVSKRSKYDLIYCGTAYISFGIISCIEFIIDFPEYTLTVIGAMPPETQQTIDQFYHELAASGRLIIDKNYYELDELTKIISTFRIGMVFYDFYHHCDLRKFNVYTAPSGKLYQYFNSGIPVIGNDLPGFAIIKHQNAGVLIPHLSTLQIKKAIDQIESDYKTYALNAKKVSELMDSKTAIENFINKALQPATTVELLTKLTD